MSVKPASEQSADQIADYLRDHPEFFDRHADVFADMTVPAPHGGKAVSLLERQLMAVKDKARAMEMKLAEMIRAGQENDAIIQKLAGWTRTLVAARDAAELPALVETGVAGHFNVPHVALRVWDIDASFEDLPCATPVAVDVITFANGLMAPYCGPNSGFAAAAWIEGDVLSLAMLPLRVGMAPQAFGLLVLGSADPQRFSSSMATDMLARISEAASAALSRMLPAPRPAVLRDAAS
jgi:uncharacterized protein